MGDKTDKRPVTRKNIKKRLENTSLGLFDHIKEIKENQGIRYYDSLNEEDVKSFNKFMILRVLSMNKDIINTVAEISLYSDCLPDNVFYKLLINKIPKDNRYHKYIKRSQSAPESKIISSIINYYDIGYKDAIEYYNILTQSDTGLLELIALLEDSGYSEDEISKMFNL